MSFVKTHTANCRLPVQMNPKSKDSASPVPGHPQPADATPALNPPISLLKIVREVFYAVHVHIRLLPNSIYLIPFLVWVLQMLKILCCQEKFTVSSLDWNPVNPPPLHLNPRP